MTDAIQLPMRHRLLAAVGWLELGNPEEALLELRPLEAGYGRHPDVLEIGWSALAQAEDWGNALEKATLLHRIAPERAGAWIHLAYSLRRVEGKGLKLAWDVLRAAHDQFPDEPIIAFNLACYACQMERRQESMQWLKRALQVGERAQIIAMALQDSDLDSLREDIQRL